MDEGFNTYAQDVALKRRVRRSGPREALLRHPGRLPLGRPPPPRVPQRPLPGVAARLPLGRHERPVLVAARRRGDPDQRLLEDGARARLRRADARPRDVGEDHEDVRDALRVPEPDGRRLPRRREGDRGRRRGRSLPRGVGLVGHVRLRGLEGRDARGPARRRLGRRRGGAEVRRARRSPTRRRRRAGSRSSSSGGWARPSGRSTSSWRSREGTSSGRRGTERTAGSATAAPGRSSSRPASTPTGSSSSTRTS